MNYSAVLKTIVKEKENGELVWAAFALDTFLSKIKKGESGLKREFLSDSTDPLPLAEIKDLLKVVRIAEKRLSLEDPIRKIAVLVQQLFELFLQRNETLFAVYVLQLEQVMDQLFRYTHNEIAKAFVETLWLGFPQSTQQLKKYRLQSLFQSE